MLIILHDLFVDYTAYRSFRWSHIQQDAYLTRHAKSCRDNCSNQHIHKGFYTLMLWQSKLSSLPPHPNTEKNPASISHIKSNKTTNTAHLQVLDWGHSYLPCGMTLLPFTLTHWQNQTMALSLTQLQMCDWHWVSVNGYRAYQWYVRAYKWKYCSYPWIGRQWRSPHLPAQVLSHSLIREQLSESPSYVWMLPTQDYSRFDKTIAGTRSPTHSFELASSS